MIPCHMAGSASSRVSFGYFRNTTGSKPPSPLHSPSWFLLKTFQFKATASGWYLLLSRLNWWSLVSQHWYTWYLLYVLVFKFIPYRIVFRCRALCFQSSFTPFLMGYCVNSGTGHSAYDYNEVDKSRWNRPQILESESTDVFQF